MRVTKAKILAKLGELYSRKIESLPYRNWFNPIMTFYLNIRSFPLKQALRFPVFVYGWPKFFSLYGKMECDGICKTGMIRLNQTDIGAPSNPGTGTAINNWGRIIFHGPCLIYTANMINVARGAVLELGSFTKILHFCNITAHNNIYIGDNTRVAHRSQILDSNFHFIANFNKHVVSKYTKPIHIGKSCWICNSSSVTGGAKLPDYTIVASNSLVNRDLSSIPTESIVGGIPAKYISSGFRKVNSPELEGKIWKYFHEHPEENDFPLDESFEHSECDKMDLQKWTL